jgi:uncharacterized protein YndB with AHSA1/START domain
MDPITVETTISRPREEVFEYLADIANHAEFSDHYLVDWHLLRVESYGLGAGARFRIDAPLTRFGWADMTFSEVQAPFKILERGRGGKYNRIRMIGTYELTPNAGNTSTKVEFTYETEPVFPSDKLLDAINRGWTRRNMNKAMRRLRTILEQGRGRGKRVSIAGVGAGPQG